MGFDVVLLNDNNIVFMCWDKTHVEILLHFATIFLSCYLHRIIGTTCIGLRFLISFAP